VWHSLNISPCIALPAATPIHAPCVHMRAHSVTLDWLEKTDR